MCNAQAEIEYFTYIYIFLSTQISEPPSFLHVDESNTFKAYMITFVQNERKLNVVLTIQSQNVLYIHIGYVCSNKRAFCLQHNMNMQH